MWKKAVTFMQEKSKAQAVPEGCLVVPKVPTETMIKQGQFFLDYNIDVVPEIYQAMIEASESGAEG